MSESDSRTTPLARLRELAERVWPPARLILALIGLIHVLVGV